MLETFCFNDIDELCLNCGANATCSCDICGIFCDECLVRRHQHSSTVHHTAKVNDLLSNNRLECT